MGKILFGLIMSAFVFFFFLLPAWEIFRDLTKGREGHGHDMIMPGVESAAAAADDRAGAIARLRAKQAELAKAKAAKQKATETAKTKKTGHTKRY